MPYASPRAAIALFLGLFLAALTRAVIAEDTTPPDTLQVTVGAALTALDSARQDDNWLFTLSMVENGESRLIQHDPRKKAHLQRTLLAVDGAAPNPEQQQEFRQQEKKRIDERDPEASYSRLVDLDTLEIIEKSGTTSHMTFAPRLHGMENVQSDLEGRLLLNNSTGQIDKIEIYNTAAFSPVFSVKVKTFRLEFQFHEVQGARLLETMRSHTRGKAGFLKSFESLVTISFTDFQRISPAPALSQALPE